MKLMASLALASVAVSAHAQAPADYRALDPLDATGEQFRVAVRDCHALEEALDLMRLRHGWLIADEIPRVVHGPDLQQTSNAIGLEGTCMRTVTFQADYAVTDPGAAIQAVLDAYNTASPPFTAQLGTCGSTRCVVPDMRSSEGGGLESAPALLDTPVTLAAASRTPRELLDEVFLQLQAATQHELVLEVDDLQDDAWREEQSWDAYTLVPARTVLTDLTRFLGESAFEQKWSERTFHSQQAALRNQIGKAADVRIVDWMRQGYTQAEIQEMWDQVGSQVEADFVPEAPEPTPSAPAGLGPGWSWTVTSLYSEGAADREILRLNDVFDPDHWAWDRPLPNTVPVPGLDGDGDGVANDLDQCDGTELGALVTRDGCAVDQACPCDGAWVNPGAYKACVRDYAQALVQAGLLARNEKGSWSSASSQQGCGH